MGIDVNLGCGVDIRDGYVNVDHVKRDGVDIVCELGVDPLPFSDDSVDHFLAFDLVEHIAQVLPFFQECYRCAAPDCLMQIAMPYGSSDDAWTDPTHVRPWFLDSWAYLSQPYYFRLDYGYTADWRVTALELDVLDFDETDEALLERLVYERNVVKRQNVVLQAVKPARSRDQSLVEFPPFKFRRVAVDGE